MNDFTSPKLFLVWKEKSSSLPEGPLHRTIGSIFSAGMTWPHENVTIRDASAPALSKSSSRNSEMGCIVPPATITDLQKQYSH